VRGYGVDDTVLAANWIEALLAVGDWDEAERASVTVLRTLTASYSYMALIIRADVELGRGHFDTARAHLEAARATLREDRGLGVYDAYRAELALWERRWADAAQAIDDGLTQAQPDEAAQIRVQLCAKGLRAQAELAALARARRADAALRSHLDRARDLLAVARRAAADAAPITPNAAAWHLLARAEHARAGPARAGGAAAQEWVDAAAAWDRLERPPLAAYCRWRQAEALIAAGASRAEASVPLRDAHAVAARIGARPLATELELLAQRARLDLTPPVAGPPTGKRALEEALGLTRREADVLALIARGYTNREIASTLVISVKTAGVHVSHILRKLDAPNRLEAAAVAHRLTPGPSDDV
jgi:DNA-binding NarL/FixJ family response regulator